MKKLLIYCLILLPGGMTLAQSATTAKPPTYFRTDVMIPMRDGVKLHTVIVRPAGSDKSGEPLPFLMQRTPYGVDGMDPKKFTTGPLVLSGYIYIGQDIRGRYKSEGQFVMNHPIVAHNGPADIDETTDTYDTVEWLVKNVPNNSGKVGVSGVSYPGFLAMMAGINHHPAVKAISPQAPMTNIWMGDDFFHNGAFRQTYGFDYVQEMEAQKTDKVVEAKGDQYDWFLKQVNFAGAAAAAGMSDLPTAKHFLSEPQYSPFWQAMAVEPHLGVPEVPTLEVGGYWDQEDMWGTQAEYAALHAAETKAIRDAEAKGKMPKNAEAHKVFMVLGPWNHGGWGGNGDELGADFGKISFGQSTGDYFREQLQAPFFEHYLKGRADFTLEDTASFRTGENAWHRYAMWPPKDGFHQDRVYLEPNKSLSFTEPQGDYNTVAATYVSDPANPVPYRHRPIQSTYGEGSKWRTWLVEDQRFVADRKDIAAFSTGVLTGDLTVTGDVVADIYAATTGSDADWIVKLIDVYPDDKAAGKNGYELMVASEILRGRYRNSFTTPEAVSPGAVNEYKWSLHGADHTFLKGHKIMVEVQSTWFPLYDRNPQTWVPNIMSAPASAYKPETVTVYGSAKYPSHLELPLMDGSTLPQ